MITLTLLVRSWMPYWVFQARQGIIAETYCMSRGIEGNSCQGSCFLRHSLQQQETENGQAPLIDLQENELEFLQGLTENLEVNVNRTVFPIHHRNDAMMKQLSMNPDSPPPWHYNCKA